MKIFFAGILCAAATALVAFSLRDHQHANAPHANHTAQKWLLPRSATAHAAAATTTRSQPLAAPTVSPNWIINSHGQCCEGNLAAEGPSTYLLLPILVTGNEILRSDDGGVNWAQKYPLANASVPFGIEGDLNAFGNDIVYFGTEVAVGVAAHSSDRGQNWTVVQIPVAFVANDQAWAYLGPFSNMRPGTPLPTDAPYVLTGWYRIGSVALFSFDGGLTWPIQTPLVGDDGSGSVHAVCEQMAHAPTSPGDTRIPDKNFVNHKAGHQGCWGTDRKFYWTEPTGGSLYVCKTDNFGATWTGIKHTIAAGPGSGYVVSHAGFDNRGTLYVLHGDKLYVSFNQGEDFAFTHTLPRWGNALLSDSGADQFFVANCGTIHIALIEAGTAGSNNVWYLHGTGVDTATPTWDQELVDIVGSDRLDFMQIVINGNDIPTISYTKPTAEVTTASRNAPMPGNACIVPVSVVSRMTHGSITTPPFFDIPLPLPVGTSPRGVECRSSASLGAGNYTLVFTFPNNLTSVGGASVTGHDPTSGTGTVSGSVVVGPTASLTANQCAVNLTNVSNGQYITVTLNSVLDVTGAGGNVIGPQLGVLIGDVNGDGFVLSGDYTTVRKNSGNNVDGTTFKYDINADGFILSGDYTTVRKLSGTQLPSTP